MTLRSTIGRATRPRAAGFWSAFLETASCAAKLTLWSAVLMWGLTGHAWAVKTSEVKTEQVRATLVAHAPEGVAAGKPLWLGLRIEHQPHWHTYWKNPGDSGLPTTLTWGLPAGFSAGEISWPTPKQLPVGPLMNFGYEGTLLLPVQVSVPAGFQGPSLPVRLDAQWLVCKDVCIPESGEFALEVPVQAATVAHAALFEATRTATPRTWPQVQARAQVQAQGLQITVQGLPAEWQGQALKFFPETAGVIDNAARPTASWQDGHWVALVPLSPQRSESPTLMPALCAGAGAVVPAAGQGPLTSSASCTPAGAPSRVSTAGISVGLSLRWGDNGTSATQWPSCQEAVG
ncbi:MAG: protein-disulfide reductase DsbD domain-containing protein, partial [Rubrivivax sp.]